MWEPTIGRMVTASCGGGYSADSEGSGREGLGGRRACARSRWVCAR